MHQQYIATIVFLILTQVSGQKDNSKPNYVLFGAERCPFESNIFGYSNITKLNHDMYTEALYLSENSQPQNKEHVYIICPGTRLKLYNEDNNETDSLIPTLDNTIIKCGQDGSIENNCLLFGGKHHVVIHPFLKIRNVTFSGLTFSNNQNGVSIAAWGNPLSSAYFYNCRWVSNEGYNIVEISYDSDSNNINDGRRRLQVDSFPKRNAKKTFYDDTNIRRVQSNKSKENIFVAMTLGFYDCIFENNNVTTSIILNHGGILEIKNNNFESNYAIFTVGVVFGGVILMNKHNKFLSNEADFYNMFIDSSSFYLCLDESSNTTISMNNTGNTCNNGIFIETKTNYISYCLEGKQCVGKCYSFQNKSSCMVYSKDDEESPVMNSVMPENILPLIEENKNIIQSELQYDTSSPAISRYSYARTNAVWLVISMILLFVK